MNELNLKNLKEKSNIIDPVTILNKYALFSTYIDDIIFIKKEPIFCGGIIKDLGRNVYNLKINEFVGYLSLKTHLNLRLSSNLIVKLNEVNKHLIFSLPYASYAMNILRKINPKLGQNVVVIGLNFFSLLLFKLMRLSGANIYIFNLNSYPNTLMLDEKEKPFIMDKYNDYLKTISIDSLILTKLSEEILEFVGKIRSNLKVQRAYLIEHHLNPNLKAKINLHIDQIMKYDKGFFDPDYNKGIKYPFSYVRWDFKRNLEYFVSLVEKNLIKLNYFKIYEVKLNSVKEIKEKIGILNEELLNDKLDQHQEKSLILFHIQSKENIQ